MCAAQVCVSYPIIRPTPMKRSFQRRDFIKGSALLAAGLALPGLTSRVSAAVHAPRRPGPTSRLNLGLVGFGTIAHATTPNFLSDPRVQIVAVADPVSELPNYG